MKTFKILGERFLKALDWMAYIDRERRRYPQSFLLYGHPDRPLATRFRMFDILGTVSIQHLWPDARDLLRRNAALRAADLDIGALLESLERRYRPEILEAFTAFLGAVACGEVTEGDLQT